MQQMNIIIMKVKAKHFYKIVPCLPGKDLRKTIDWYQNKLGFSEAWFWGSPPTDVGIQRDDLRLIFGLGEPFKGLDVMIFVDNVDSIYQEIQEKKIRVVYDIKDEPYGLREFTIEDINGYRLRLAESIE